MRRAAKLVLACLAGFAACGAPPASAEIVVGLIIKTQTNPFFVKMREGAQAKAKEMGVTLVVAAGKYDGDNDSQVAAVENLIARGAKGFAIVPSDSKAIVPAIAKARAGGLKVIALDTPLDPVTAADATFATDNRKAGMLIGQWARVTMADKAKTAKIAFLDLASTQPTVDYLRNQGFMQGFGIDVKNPNRIGDEKDTRICGHFLTQGDQEKGRTAMEYALQKCPDVNLVYTINEPAAAGAWQALKGAGLDDGSVRIVSVDGGCPGVRNVKDGVIGATAQQYPRIMAAMALDAIVSGKIPRIDPKQGFFDTGVQLVTARPAAGVPSISVENGLKLCWG